MSKFKLTARDVDKYSENPFFKREGTTYSKDRRSAGDQLFLDFKRQVKLNQISYNKNNHEDLNDQEEWEKFLNQQFSREQIKSLQQHYSQGPLLSLSASHASLFSPRSDPIYFAQPHQSDIKLHLYQDKNGNVYFKGTVKKIPVKDFEGNLVGNIKGPAEVLFKLDKKEGFKLQHIETDSKFMRDMFMGKDITVDRTHKELDTSKPEFIYLVIPLLAMDPQQRSDLGLLEKTVREKLSKRDYPIEYVFSNFDEAKKYSLAEGRKGFQYMKSESVIVTYAVDSDLKKTITSLKAKKDTEYKLPTSEAQVISIDTSSGEKIEFDDNLKIKSSSPRTRPLV